MVAMDSLDRGELVKILHLVLRRYQQGTCYDAGSSLAGSSTGLYPVTYVLLHSRPRVAIRNVAYNYEKVTKVVCFPSVETTLYLYFKSSLNEFGPTSNLLAPLLTTNIYHLSAIS